MAMAVEAHGNGQMKEMQGNKGIMVSSEFYIQDDKVSTSGDRGQKDGVPENWTNLGTATPGVAR